MGRFPGKVLVLLAITLVLANAGCLARCIVDSCQVSPPPCHSHSKGDAQHCPQQNQMKMAATGAVALDWGMAFIPVDRSDDAVQAEQPYTLTTPLRTPPQFDPAPLALRI